jgi:hypothetical protein
VSLINLTALNILTLGFTKLILNILTVRICVSYHSHSPQHSHTRVYRAQTHPALNTLTVTVESVSLINLRKSDHSVEVDPASIQLLRALKHAEDHGAQAQVQDVDEQQRDPALRNRRTTYIICISVTERSYQL